MAAGAKAKSGGLKAKIETQLRRWPWLWHVYEAWDHLKEHNGTQYSAAITYFSFLALFPLLLLAASIAGFVLSSRPASAAGRCSTRSPQNIPGDFGQQLTKSIKTAISNRTGVGIIGLAGVLLTGLGWVNNLRQAIDAVAGHERQQENFLVNRGRNLMILAGLGLGVLISIGLTIVGTAVTDQLLRSVGLEHATGVSFVLTVGGIVVALIGDLLIFWWVLVQMPKLGVAPPHRDQGCHPRRGRVRGPQAGRHLHDRAQLQEPDAGPVREPAGGAHLDRAGVALSAVLRRLDDDRQGLAQSLNSFARPAARRVERRVSRCAD